jgi:polyhydroxybutyrate depolymerase
MMSTSTRRIAPLVLTVALGLTTPSTRAEATSPLEDAFRRTDINSDGKLSTEEVNRFPRLKTRLAGADKDGDGWITFEEFRAHLIAGPRPPTAPTPPTSPATQLAAGEHTRTIAVDDVPRRYRVHVPKNYDAAKPTPVVLVYHGGGGNPGSMVRLTGLDTKSEEAGFIVVYPYGSGLDPERLLTFNGGECCGFAMQRKIDDVTFTRALLDDLATVANVDANRVFATGLSNGGIMSHYVASELSDRIAAIAPVGGPLMMDACRPKRPVPVMHFHGTGDEFAPFNGGYGKGGAGGKGVTDFKSVEHTIQSWVKANGCQPEPEIVALPDKANDGMKSTRKTWGGGKEGSEVVLIEIENGGHTWPGMDPPVAMLGKSTKDISANDLMWEFFQRHPLPSSR